MARDSKKKRERVTEAIDVASPKSRVTKIARLLADLADLMRQEDVGKESLHHLRQLQMRVRFALTKQGAAPEPDQDVPTEAPARWLERHNRDESPIDFIAREYGRWLGKGLTRAHLRQLDMSLYEALKYWLRSHDLPQEFDLPTKQQMIDRQVSTRERVPVIHSAEQRERLRLDHAARRRAAKRDA